MKNMNTREGEQRATESINAYFRKIGNLKLLTHDEEMAIGRRIEEEERRLCYVGMTRAKKELIMLAASICTGYSKAPQLAMVDILVKKAKKKKTIKVIALQPDDVRKLMIK